MYVKSYKNREINRFETLEYPIGNILARDRKQKNGYRKSKSCIFVIEVR